MFYLPCFVSQIVDRSEIEKMVDKVLADNPEQLKQYRGGKTKLQGYFAGQVFLQNVVVSFILMILCTCAVLFFYITIQMVR